MGKRCEKIGNSESDVEREIRNIDKNMHETIAYIGILMSGLVRE